MTQLVHNTLGTEPSRINLEVLDDRLRVTVPVRNYAVSGISLLPRRMGRMYEVSETAATRLREARALLRRNEAGAIDFMDNPERAEREERAPHRGKEILARIAAYLARQPDVTESQSPEKPTSPPTFTERVTSTKPEQLHLIL